MIELYFEGIEQTIKFFKPVIQSFSVDKKIYNDTKGYIKGVIVFYNNSQLHFAELKSMELHEKPKYRYHYINEKKALIFRYDNSLHHPNLSNFPHHKHLSEKIVESAEPELYDIILEIKALID